MATTTANYRGHLEPSTVHREESDESATPIPEMNCVKIAQDFILQYYSVRTRYPESLYRFYREDSTLTMGCHQDERVVTGKAAIAEHLASVGYHNCSNSVAAFNAQFVLPNCIAILISGEMSNNDEMLRRYCEMFSLIRYDVDRFYVKSHMFHFQDDAFNDNSACSGSVCDQPQQQQTQPTVPETVIHEKAAEIVVHTENGFTETRIDHAGDHHHTEVTVLLESHHTSHTVKTLPTETAQINTTAHQHQAETENTYDGHSYDSKEATVSQSWDNVPEQRQNGTTEEAPCHVPAAIPTGPAISKTWAGIAGSGTTSHAPPQSHNQQHPRQQQPRRSAAPGGGPAGGHENGRPNVKFSSGGVVGESGESDGQEGTEPHRRPRGGPPQSSGPNGHFRGGNGNSNQGPRKSGNHMDRQLFVGNLPYDCDENEVRGFFEQFGPVVQVRVNPSKDNLPWYGFVIMETAESVNKVLKTRPLLLRGNHRINAEKRNFENGGGGGPRRDFRKSQFPHGGEQVAR